MFGHVIRRHLSRSLCILAFVALSACDNPIDTLDANALEVYWDAQVTLTNVRTEEWNGTQFAPVAVYLELPHEQPFTTALVPSGASRTVAIKVYRDRSVNAQYHMTDTIFVKMHLQSRSPNSTSISRCRFNFTQSGIPGTLLLTVQSSHAPGVGYLNCGGHWENF